ncbi:MAG: hypothetical protein ACYS8L_10770 [Planctomycetota bacterium]|jgi:hypothetical protein
MAKVELQCPSCGGLVELGDVECVHCGVNLRSGESYETRVRQARGKGLHPEHFAPGLYMGAAIAFALAVFAGWMYQRAVQKTIQDKPGFFRYPVLRIQELDDLVAAGHIAAAKGKPNEADYHYNRARKGMEELIHWIDAEDARIRVKDPYSPETPDRHTWRVEKKYNKRGAKRLLKNLRAKAEFKLSQIPTMERPVSGANEGSET